LPNGADLSDEVVSVVGGPGEVQVGEKRRHVLFEPSRRGHASPPATVAGAVSGSAVTLIRIAASA
jgi:hypothetical protein